MKSHRKLSKIQLIILFLIFTLLTVALYRAVVFPYTYDESYTYLVTSRRSFVDIILYIGKSQANNHVVNTLFVKILGKVFGMSELIGRISPLIGFILFSIATWGLSMRQQKTFLVLSTSIILYSNPYLFSYFSISRGYGLAMGFILLAIYLYVERGTKKHFLLLSYFSGILAVISNLTSLTFFIPFLGLGIIEKWRQLIKSKIDFLAVLSSFREELISVFALLATALVPIIRLQQGGSLYFGGTTSFIDDSLWSLLTRSLQGFSSLTLLPYFAFSFIVVVLLAAFIIIISGNLASHNRKQYMQELFFAFSLLAGSVVFSILQHQLLGSPFLYKRTALLFVPEFLFLVVTLSAYIQRQLNHGNLLRIYYYTVTLICILVIANYVRFNLGRFSDWPYDLSIKVMLTDISQLREQTHSDTVTLAIHRDTQPSLQYYKEAYNLEWLNYKYFNSIEQVGNTRYDYYYFPFSEHKQEVLKEYIDSGLALSRDVK